MKLFNTRKVFLRRDYDELVIESPGFDNRSAKSLHYKRLSRFFAPEQNGLNSLSHC